MKTDGQLASRLPRLWQVGQDEETKHVAEGPKASLSPACCWNSLYRSRMRGQQGPRRAAWTGEVGNHCPEV